MTSRPPVTGGMTDEELVAAFLLGSEEAFTILVGKYKNPLLNFVFRMLGDYDGALDVVQDTFVRVHAKAGSYRPVAKFSTWIYTIASNLARTEMRRRRWGIPGGRTEAEVRDTDELPDKRADLSIRAEMIGKALAALPVRFREAVVLFYMEDVTYQEICSILGIRMGTLKSRLSRARALLGDSLRPLMEEDDSR